MEEEKHFLDVFLGDGQLIDVERTVRRWCGRRAVWSPAILTVGAIVMEDANMAPFAYLVQQAVGLPVFDIQTLTNWVAGACQREAYGGPREGTWVGAARRRPRR